MLLRCLPQTENPAYGILFLFPRAASQSQDRLALAAAARVKCLAVYGVLNCLHMVKAELLSRIFSGAQHAGGISQNGGDDGAGAVGDAERMVV